MSTQKSNDRLTYGEYCSWDASMRWELIDGVAYNMPPAPTRQHQKISMELAVRLYKHLQGKPCEVYASPFDVLLPDFDDQLDNEVTTFVQPDLVVCEAEKLTERGCKGAPTLIIEILSPGKAAYDVKTKFNLYERVGVREYWIVHPIDRTVMVFKLNPDGEYGRPDMYGKRDRVSVPLLGDLEIDLALVFGE
jgi:Uma2 family endonuclease